MEKRNRNAGLSLIEYIVAFTVLSIAVLGIWGFYLAATNNFTRVNKHADLYNEAQLTVNQLERIIVNADLGVAYDDTQHVLTLYDISYDTEGNQSGIIMQAIKWDESAQKLFYGEAELKDATSEDFIPAMAADTEWELMSEGVTKFEITLEEGNNRLVADLKLVEGNFDYNAAGNLISFRNKVIFIENSTTVGDLEHRMGTLPDDTVTGVTISIKPTVVTTGSTARLDWTVTGGAAVSQAIDQWVIAKDANLTTLLDEEQATVSDDGSLYLNFESELPKSLYFQAKIADTDDQGEVLGYVTSNIVQLRFVQNMTISSENKSASGSETMSAGESLQMYVDVKADDLSQLEKMVTWSIEDGGTASATVDSYGLVKVASTSPSGYVNVVATLKAFPSISMKRRIEVKSDYKASGSLDITAYAYENSSWTEASTVNRGGEVRYYVSYNNETVNPEDCNWSVVIREGDASSEAFQSNAVSIGATGVLSIKESLYFWSSYTAVVSASLKSNPSVSGYMTIVIPMVSVKFSEVKTIQGTGTQKALACQIQGLENYNIKWTFGDSGEAAIISNNAQLQVVGRKEGEWDVAYIGFGSHYSGLIKLRATIVEYPQLYGEKVFEVQ